MIKIKEEFKSRKFLFGILGTIIFCLSVWVFKMEPMATAGALTTLYAPFFIANVAGMIKKKVDG